MLKKIKRIFFYALYYGFARHLPCSFKPYSLGSRWIRYWICKKLFRSCGKGVNIEHGASIGDGKDIMIGDYSNIGINCWVNKAVLGKYVMMGPDVFFVRHNHNFSDPDNPLHGSGIIDKGPIYVGDNTWIGTKVVILPGIKIGKNAIVGAGAIVTKDVPDYAIVAGNPAKIIKIRK